jgi:hypothetical protein
MEYDVRITVVREITVPVTAANMAQAKSIAEQRWSSNDYAQEPIRSQKVSFATLYPELGAFEGMNWSNPARGLSLVASPRK